MTLLDVPHYWLGSNQACEEVTSDFGETEIFTMYSRFLHHY